MYQYFFFLYEINYALLKNLEKIKLIKEKKTNI